VGYEGASWAFLPTRKEFMTNSDAARGNVSRLVNSLNDVRLFSAWLKRVEAAAHESETRLWETMKPEIADIYSGAVQARTFKQLNEPGLTNEQLVSECGV
jgi:hypothetical protein